MQKEVAFAKVEVKTKKNIQNCITQKRNYGLIVLFMLHHPLHSLDDVSYESPTIHIKR